MSVLEAYLATSLDFGGISTEAAETALRRAYKGGMLTGDLCQGVATLIHGAQGIQSTLRGARSTAQGSSYLEQIEVLVNPCVLIEPVTSVDTCTSMCCKKDRARLWGSSEPDSQRVLPGMNMDANTASSYDSTRASPLAASPAGAAAASEKQRRCILTGTPSMAQTPIVYLFALPAASAMRLPTFAVPS